MSRTVVGDGYEDEKARAGRPIDRPTNWTTKKLGDLKCLKLSDEEKRWDELNLPAVHSGNNKVGSNHYK